MPTTLAVVPALARAAGAGGLIRPRWPAQGPAQPAHAGAAIQSVLKVHYQGTYYSRQRHIDGVTWNQQRNVPGLGASMRRVALFGGLTIFEFDDIIEDGGEHSQSLRA